eukprot:jgi/Psemu1/304617/fgenesh1_kg.163_\
MVTEAIADGDKSPHKNNHDCRMTPKTVGYIIGEHDQGKDKIRMKIIIEWTEREKVTVGFRCKPGLEKK